MHISKRFMALLVLALAAATTAALHAHGYPNKPVRIIVPWPAGSGTDVLGRLMAARLSTRLNQSFVVDNRTGAASNIGMAAVAGAAADSYTLGLATSNLAMSLALVAKGTYALAVHPAVPAQNIQQLLALVARYLTSSTRQLLVRAPRVIWQWPSSMRWLASM